MHVRPNSTAMIAETETYEGGGVKAKASFIKFFKRIFNKEMWRRFRFESKANATDWRTVREIPIFDKTTNLIFFLIQSKVAHWILSDTHNRISNANTPIGARHNHDMTFKWRYFFLNPEIFFFNSLFR